MTRFVKYTLLIGFCFAIALLMADDLPDKASPFTAVKWNGNQPEVRFQGDWYQFHSINDISVESIVEFCKATYEDRWKKRFSEDFVEVLTKMGHKPGIQVELVLSKAGNTYSKTGTMTEENREMVSDYNKGEDKTGILPGEAEAQASSKDAEISSQEQLAKQMAEWIDKVWDADPPNDAANLKFLLTKNGAPFAGKIDIKGEFTFRARGKEAHHQAFNPNSKGRWVFEGLPPGTYDLSITGSNAFEGWEWSKKAVEIQSNTKPFYEINLD